ncbi:hypothetical protein BS47DRAFT_1373824 [Hydnum rufescens UP504]|uniref:glycine--tRNA ligase n=1 Tax=Hydnum rufescens UP504 TaxID=1448309 RepID=A0A9P6AL85_9AGAM|nr:hypothetical protein BS47DRAFT_1373824 [Hydnum rufescens UP504]
MSHQATVLNKAAHPFNKANLDALLNRRFFYAPAFEIYGGIAGLYDYGPPGSSLQANIIAEWRRHFIVEEHMLEVDTTIMTPAPVFETSGHVARFADWMVKDVKTGEVLRADHLIEGVLEARLKGDQEARGTQQDPSVVEDKDKKKRKKVKSTAIQLDDRIVAEYESVLAQIDNYTGIELGKLIRKYAILNPDTGNEVDDPVQFNLMFDSSIGPTGKQKGYLRPETAQGHFLNFARLLDFNNGRLPFASAQVGRSFRNEISPRAGLIRVREFTMAEIEHFVDPEDKSHVHFSEVKDVKLRLLPKDVQSSGKTDVVEMTVGESVAKGLVDNETLGYFLGRISLFLIKIEIHTSYGWIECVGCADRSAYDLTVHAKKTGAALVARVALPEPVFTEKEVPTFDKKALGKTFQKDSELVRAFVTDLPEEALVKIKNELASASLSSLILTIERRTLKQSSTKFGNSLPTSSEPSFGIGRILYALLEHSYWAREQDIQRGILSLPAVVAPTKVLIVPLSANDLLLPLVQQISAKFRRAGVFARVDDSSASIGKRYSRNDELGTPYGVTIDFATDLGALCFRERDTTDQRIGKIDEVVAVTTDLVKGAIQWAEACQRLPAYDGVQAVD